MAERKRGNLNKGETELIENMLETHTDEEIASKVNRSPELIAKKRIESPYRKLINDEVDELAKLHASHIWKEIKKQLFEGEIESMVVFALFWALFLAFSGLALAIYYAKKAK